MHSKAHPHSLHIEPQVSRVQRGMVLGVAIILIALSAYFMPAIGLFSFKNALWAAAVAAVLLWAALSCWRPASGRLRFSQGRWSLQHGDQEWLGTLSLHLDLQSYLLVRFRPDLSMGGSPSQPVQHFLNTKQPWFHLEARHFNPLALPAPRAALPAWADVRRAVYFSLATALGDDTSEKPVR